MTELIFRQFEDIKGTSIGGHDINHLRYVITQYLFQTQKRDFRVTEASIESVKAGHGMNVKKTKNNGHL